MPLLCHYPIKAQYLSHDPKYLSCKWKCNATLTFHVVNIRTDIQFILFGHGFTTPCVLGKSSSVGFANPKMPLHGHLSSVDSAATSMKLTWVSGDNAPQQIKFGNGNTKVESQVATFTQKDMCTSKLKSPAKDFGWHDPGFIHSAVMTGLKPSTAFSYRYGSDSVGWSDKIKFKTPPASGDDALRFISFGDSGRTPLDKSVEHFTQPGAAAVANALNDEVASGKFDSIFHIGDISYATGFLVEWDYFLNFINHFASKISYMTAIGNHERDYVKSGSVYKTPDSGGECGVPYGTYFPMPTSAKDKPWYSIEQGPVHFTVISSEHHYAKNSEQYAWIKSDLASVNRSRTPWLIFMSHRPFYTSVSGVPRAKLDFTPTIEPLLLANKVDLVLVAHVHNYERTCAVYNKRCLGMPVKDQNGILTYNNAKYTAPVHTTMGMAGFTLTSFPKKVKNPWSLVRLLEFGYVRFDVTRKNLIAEFVNANSRKVIDKFRLTK